MDNKKKSTKTTEDKKERAVSVKKAKERASASKKTKERAVTSVDSRGRNPDGTFAPGNDCAEKYDDKYADMLLDFFSKPLSRVEYKRTYKAGEIASETPIEFINDFPTMGMFARSIGVSVSALKAWAGITEDGKYRHARFASAYARVKEWAGGMIESGALSGKVDANMAKFVLTNDYGKQDKQIIDTHVNGIDEKDLALLQRVEARLAEQRAAENDGSNAKA